MAQLLYVCVLQAKPEDSISHARSDKVLYDIMHTDLIVNYVYLTFCIFWSIQALLVLHRIIVICLSVFSFVTHQISLLAKYNKLYPCSLYK